MAYILQANILVSLIGLLTIAVMARSLGPAGLGLLALAETYVRLVDQIVRLEPWQALIKYGAAKLDGGLTDQFARLVKFSTVVDILGACAAAFVALMTCQLAQNWLGFSDEQLRLTQFYALTLFFNLASTPTGLLRLFNKFDLISKVAVLMALLRLVFTIIAWALSGGVWSFAIILFAYSISEQLVTAVLGWRELSRRGHGQFLRASMSGVLVENPHIVRFVVNTNFSALARLSTQRFDTLLVGAFLGNAAAGIYHVARRLGIAAVKVGRPLQQALYPDLARVWSRGDLPKFRWLVFKFNALITVLALVGVALAYPFVELVISRVFGVSFMSAVPLVKLQLFAVALFLAGNTLGPALLVMGSDRAVMWLSLLATAVFFASIVPLLIKFGAAGAVVSQILFSLVALVGTWYVMLVRTQAKSDVRS
jgi:O-antigen/teichoic acid export membrane protein